MSRVERKKLEKENKKSKKVFKFKKEGSAPTKEVIEPSNSFENGKSTYVDDTIENKSLFAKSDKIQSSSHKTITADKIVSVEDERMYFERKKRQGSQGMDDSGFMTVDDIITLEDQENGVVSNDELNEIPDVNEEDDINKVKMIHIEKAPFEDIVRVAESRMQAKDQELDGDLYVESEGVVDMEDKKKVMEEDRKKIIEEDKKVDTEVNKETNGEENKKTNEEENIKEESSKLLDSVESVNRANIDDLYDSKTKNKANVPVPEKKKGGKKFKKFIFGLVGILVIIYALGCVVFSGRYFANTKINGIDAGLKKPGDIENIASKNAESYSMNIEGRKKVKDTIKGSDIDLEFVKDDSAKKIKDEQGSLAWPLAFFTDYSYDGKLNIKYDKAKLEAELTKLNINDKKNIVEPKSAVPKYDESKKELVVSNGELGSRPIKSRLVKFLDESIMAQKTDAKYPDSVYKAQKYNRDSVKVKKAVETIKPYTDVNIVYDFEYEKYPLPKQAIVSMFDLDEENQYKVELSKDKVREVVRSLSRKYSTYGDTREIQSASTGGKLKVSGGIYGWLIDREKETDALYKIIDKKENASNRKPIYSQTAVSRQKDDMGDEFIEIDLSKQYMWYVKGGEALVATPIVSGNPYNGDATPTGIYPLNYKTRNAVLRGPGYASPVSYWMPFNGNIGIHDSSWQAAYGGSRYLYAGSHGCINTPFSKVAQIYKLAKEGMPVVVHD